jgi:hypothetical protein
MIRSTLRYAALLLSLLLVRCQPETLHPFQDSITLTVQDDATTRADGMTTVKLIAALPAGTKDDYKKLTFAATTLGTVVGSATQSVGADGKATAVYKVGLDQGDHVVSITVDANTAYKKEIIYTLKPAQPESIQLEANKSSLGITDAAGITMIVYLKRAVGTVSKGTQVTAYTYQLKNPTDTVFVGRLDNLSTKKSDMDGKISFNFYGDTGDIDVNKPLTLEVRYFNTDLNKKITGVYNLKMK